MGFWGALGKGLGIVGGAVAAPFTGGASLIPMIAGAAGAGLGALSQAKAQNRGEQFGGQLSLEQLLMQRDQQNFQNQIAREQEGRAGASDAWKKLLSAQHVISPNLPPTLSPYSQAPRQATGAEMQGADALTQQVLARLQGGNPIGPFQQHAPVVDPKLLTPGLFERIAGYASPVLGAYGAMAQPQIAMSGKQPYLQRLAMSATPQNIGRG